MEKVYSGFSKKIIAYSDFNRKRIAQFISLLLLTAIFYTFLSDISINLSWFQNNLQRLHFYTDNYFLLTLLIFFLIRFFFAVISIPGSGVLTIVAGAIFDFWLGSILVTLSVSLGVLVGFLLSRYAFRNWVKKSFEDYFSLIEQISQEYGASLLFLLRITEITPSFVINSFFGITSIKATTYYWVSFIGQLPGILIFTNAGNQITEISELSDLLSTQVMLSLLAIGLIPLVSKFFYNLFLKRVG
ncbi:TVP38/TMEM64 family protein [Fuchsiella alkaliacetigena]|uniref:TVP38/TMEM64 family protein n=1 Tax=Fuchsiella alkaliacetigena TaxID=957042 RepID=UPI00200ACB13|nr:VTT domain-containing protein [Fuchsiella alkaliacetigena]MCK8823650.1 VTT domain-containing protein [Fuchsiella alkaliacetigena]